MSVRVSALSQSASSNSSNVTPAVAYCNNHTGTKGKEDHDPPTATHIERKTRPPYHTPYRTRVDLKGGWGLGQMFLFPPALRERGSIGDTSIPPS